MNHLWPLHGAAALGAVYQTPHPRAAVLGLDHAEVDRILAGIDTFFAWGTSNDWIQQWVKAGHGYSERAEVALGRGHHISAGEFWRLASVCYFFASYVHFHLVPVPARDAAQALSIAAYRKAAPLLRPAAERVEVPFQSRHLPGYLRVPTHLSQSERWPCAIVVGGTNSWKEENHAITTQFLSRGIATFVFDGPGQNEYLQDSGEPMRMKQF